MPEVGAPRTTANVYNIDGTALHLDSALAIMVRRANHPIVQDGGTGQSLSDIALSAIVAYVLIDLTYSLRS
ncbi:hypothetical protein J2X72_001379 [Phyllobacterium sp. 1468]|nr:hypothetical protein [Phyllobacterium sp. 1468]